MKKNFVKLFISVFLIVFSVVSVYAENITKIKYDNIKDNGSIYFSLDNLAWTNSKKGNVREYIKKIPDAALSRSEFYAEDGELAFFTDTEYEFIHDGKLIGYSNSDLKFYNYLLDDNGKLVTNVLTADEVSSLFSKFEIIKISEFSNSTNSLKIKKGHGNLKMILLNDTNYKFDNYIFTSHNAKFKKYPLSGLINITKPGMIQFSCFGSNLKDSIWYVLLVR